MNTCFFFSWRLRIYCFRCMKVYLSTAMQLSLFLKQIHPQVEPSRLIYDSGMLNSHVGIWRTVTLFCTLSAASYTDNYQMLIYRCQQERKWSEWLPTEIGIGFYQESWTSMFVLRRKKSPEEWLVKKYDSKMSSPKGSAVLKGIALELDNLGLNFYCFI